MYEKNVMRHLIVLITYHGRKGVNDVTILRNSVTLLGFLVLIFAK